MSRRLRYGVAVSLDGFIAGPNGEYDWIVMDPAIDFAAMYSDYDTAVMGRKTYEVMAAMGGEQAGAMPGHRRRGLLADARAGDAPRLPDCPRRSREGRQGAEEETGQGHLALRRRRPLPHAAGRGSRGHGRDRREPGAARRGHSAASARRSRDADAVGSQGAAEERHHRAGVLGEGRRRAGAAHRVRQARRKKRTRQGAARSRALDTSQSGPDEACRCSSS